MINSIMASMVIGQPDPEEGMGGTILFHSDRHPCTIIHVSKSKKTIVVREDIARYIPGDSKLGYAHTECQEWDIQPDSKGLEMTFTLRKNGRWTVKGDPMNGGTHLRLGSREKFYDPHF